MFDANDPRVLGTGARRTISLSQGDLDLAANYLAQQYAGGSARVIFKTIMRKSRSVPLPKLPVYLYVNVNAMFTEAAPHQSFNDLQLGRLPVAEWIADSLLERAILQGNRR